MKKLLILLLLFLLPLSSFAENEIATTAPSTPGGVITYAQRLTIDDGQVSTGVSPNVCTVNGYSKAGVDIAISGTSATVEIECLVHNTGTFRTVTGSSVTTSTTVGVVDLPCSELRTNVTACTACDVIAICKWNY